MKHQRALLFLFIFSALIIHLSAQNFSWAKALSGTNEESGVSITTDASGNVYTSGVFAGTVDFDPGPGTHYLTPVGSVENFISKVDASGNFAWAYRFGNANTYVIDNAVATDNSGNVYLAGSITPGAGSVDFDPGAGTAIINTTNGCGFLLKLSAAGNFVAVKILSGGPCQINDMTIDASGNILLAGHFSGTVDFDPGSGASYVTSVGSATNFFVLKLNSSANFSWVKTFVAGLSDKLNSVAADASGNVLLGGQMYFSTIDFDPGAGTYTVVANDWDAFVVELSSSGTFAWAKTITGGSFQIANAITTDASGNVYATGYFGGTPDFDPGTATYTIAGPGAFIWKLDGSGNLDWVKTMSGSGICKGIDICSDGSNYIYTIGSFDNSIDFDPGNGTATFTTTGGGGFTDVFIQKLDDSGNYQSARTFGGPSYDEGAAIHVDVNGSIYTTGIFRSTSDFDPGSGTSTITVVGLYDVFISKLCQLTLTVTASSSSICAGNSVIFTATGGSTYTWSAGDTSSTLAVTPTLNSTYTVTGTNSLGCTAFAVDSVIVHARPVIAVNSGTICNGNSFTISPGGAATYTFSGGGSIVSPSATTAYSVTGTNSLGCVSADAAVSTVTVAAAPSVSVNSGAICSGASFTITPTGAASYTFLNGGSVVSPTANTTYSIYGTNTLGCVSLAAALASITVNPLPVIAVNSGAICSGQSFSITASGAYTYTFSNAGPVVNPTSDASYSVSGTSSLGCLSASPAIANVTVFALPVVSANGGSICAGQSFTISPAGAANYTYSGNSAVVSPSATISYSVTGTSSLGCVTASAAVLTVTVNALPVITVNSGTICEGQSFTMTPGGASTYSYSSGSAIVTPSANTTYSVTGTSSFGCVSAGVAIADVTVHPRPVISVNSGSICSGQSFTLITSGATTYTYSGGSVVTPVTNSSYSVTGTSSLGCLSASPAISNVTVEALPVVVVNSGSICYGESFTISPSGAATFTISGGSTVVSPVVTTSYSVTGTNSLGCITASAAISAVTVNPLPVISVNSGSICEGQSFTMTPGGAATYTYSGGSGIVNPTTNTTYSVTGTSAFGCISASSAISSVTVYSLPVISVNSGSVCQGQSFTIFPTGADTYSVTSGSFIVSPMTTTGYSVSGTSIEGCVNGFPAISTIIVAPAPTITVNSGQICAGNSFTISPAGALTYTVTGGSLVVSPNSSSTYSVTGTTSLGCISSSAGISNVVVNPLPTISVNSGTICSGGSFTLFPAGAFTYTYSEGPIVNPLTTGSYSVSGTSLAGCTSATPAISNVTVKTTPTLIVTSSSTVICAGESVSLTVTGANTFSWNSGSDSSSIIVNPDTTTSYTVSGYAINGCSASSIFTQSVDACTGIREQLPNQDIIIYPNPTNGELFVESTHPINLVITDALGQIIIQENVRSGNVRLDLAPFAKGIYFLRTQDGQASSSRRIIKE